MKEKTGNTTPTSQPQPATKEFYELSSNKTLDELGDDGVMGVALLIRKAILLSPKLSPEQKKQQLQEWSKKYF